MNDSGGITGGGRWGMLDQPRNLGLQLMSAVAERENSIGPECLPTAIPVISHGNGRYVDWNEYIPTTATSQIEYPRAMWIHPNDIHRMNGSDSKIFHPLSVNSNYGRKDHHFGAIIHEATPIRSQMLQIGPSSAQVLAKHEPMQEEMNVPEDKSVKKEGKAKKVAKVPKVRKPRAPKPNNEENGSSQLEMKSGGALVVNGITLDLACIPIPVCSCTGSIQQCYKWGSGGWQSACCTTTLSVHPLPMSTKRRGARIAGRKMSRGAFKKVLEKILSEGHSLSNPVDLRTYWAKHGTNKFVTIR